MESILTSIKKKLGLGADYTPFDPDIIIAINAAFSVLTQLGVGPEKGFFICGPSETWSSYLGDRDDLEFIKEYVYLKVRYMFDPPAGSVLSAMNELIKEYEWRINVAVDPSKQQN